MKTVRALVALALSLIVSVAVAQTGWQSWADRNGNNIIDATDQAAAATYYAANLGARRYTASPTRTSTAGPTATRTSTPSATATRTLTPVPSTATPAATLTAPAASAQRMVVVVLENRSLADVQANAYFAGLAARGRLLTNYTAITNPSQPNYVAMLFGDTMGVIDNRDALAIDGANLVDQLEGAGVSWKSYQENYPGGCFNGYYAAADQLYARKHNAFISANTVRTNSARCAKIQDGLAMDADIASGTLPRYSLYVPNRLNNSHDTDVAYAAGWLQSWLDPKLANPSLADVLWVITWDEGTIDGPERISTILIGPGITPGTTDAGAYTHYSLLRTTQALFGLGSLGRNDATAPLIPLSGGSLATATPSATFLPQITNTPAAATATPTSIPGGSMAFPTTSVYDNLNRADGAIGANYTTDVFAFGGAGLQIVSNQLQGASVSHNGWRNTASYTGVVENYVDITGVPTGTGYIEVGVAFGPGASTTDAYCADYEAASGWTLYRVTNGTYVQLGSYNTSYTPSVGDKMGIRHNDANGLLELFLYRSGAWDSTAFISQTDTTFSGSKFLYYYIKGTTTAIDNLGGGAQVGTVSVKPLTLLGVG